jgi:hypothetical protein
MNLRRISLTFGLLAMAAAWNASAVAAGEICCALCGGHDSCNKVCRLVCEEKKVDVICWGVKCEDFCTPGPSKPGCKHCDVVCDQCDPKAKAKPDDPHSKARSFVWRDWIPWKSPQIHTKRKLMQKIETKKIPSYKWVVEDLCKECESKAKSAAVAPDAEVPFPPAIDARVIPVDFAGNPPQ